MRVLLLALLLVGAAAADPMPRSAPDNPAKIYFNVYPHDAVVRDEHRPESYTALPNPLIVSELGERTQRWVWISKPGWKQARIKLDGSDLRQDKGYWKELGDEYRFPADGSIVLQPENTVVAATYWMKTHPLLTGGAVLAILGLAGYAVYSSAKGRKLEKELKAEAEHKSRVAGTTDPLLKEQATFGTIQIRESLGSGGMAAVYKACNKANGEWVALKVMHGKLAEDPQYCLRFQREGKAMTQLEHPNIVRLMDWGDENGRLYLAMEYIQGETLENRIPPDGMELKEACAILLDVMGALASAHNKGIVHRDIKPQNIMLTEADIVKVMDFGLAANEDWSTITQTGASMGTPAYLPPEQFTGGQLDARSDQYSLGIMAYQMFTGRTPFQAQDVMDMIFKHMSQPAPAPSDFRLDLTPSLERWVLKLLAKDPAKRFPSMADAREALQKAMHDSTAGKEWIVEEVIEPPPLVKVSPASTTVTDSGDTAQYRSG